MSPFSWSQAIHKTPIPPDVCVFADGSTPFRDERVTGRDDGLFGDEGPTDGRHTVVRPRTREGGVSVRGGPYGLRDGSTRLQVPDRRPRAVNMVCEIIFCIVCDMRCGTRLRNLVEGVTPGYLLRDSRVYCGIPGFQTRSRVSKPVPGFLLCVSRVCVPEFQASKRRCFSRTGVSIHGVYFQVRVPKLLVLVIPGYLRCVICTLEYQGFKAAC